MLDEIALVRAAITYDHDAQQVLLVYSQPDLVRDWLLNRFKRWLLNSA
jgi:hypothetical protein